MPQQSEQLTAAEISRLAGVTRATVSNWRRRHADFPRPSGGTEASPTYDRVQIEAWLAARGQLPEPSPKDELAAELRTQREDAPLSALYPVVVALSRMAPEAVGELAARPETALVQELAEVTEPFADAVPAVGGRVFRPCDAALLRAVLKCVREEGALPTVELIGERLAPDTTVRGSYPTPPPVIELMIDLLADGVPSAVLDPACGTGGFLAAASQRGAAHLYGQDIVTERADLAAARLGVLASDATATIRTGDSLRNDAFPGLAVDAVLCNPPFADRSWGHDELAYDPRWVYGLPPKLESELAWIQHCLAHLKPGGTAVMLMPPGVAERPSGRRIRSELVRNGAVRAVVSLAPGAAPPFNVGLHLWVLRRPDPSHPSADPVLFVDASQADGWDAVRDTTLEAWRSFVNAPADFEPVPGIARAVPVLDLMHAEMDLTPVRHVRTVAPIATPGDFAAAVNRRRAELRRAAETLLANDGTDWPPVGDEPVTWRTVTVGDLLRGNALAMERAVTGSRGAGETTGGGDAQVMSAQDVTSGGAPSKSQTDYNILSPVLLEEGDVLLPEIISGGMRARVVGPDDAGSVLGPHVLLFRPDPSRLDSWFLAGFLSAEENVHGAATGTSIIRIQPRRLRVPLMPLDKQREYGRAFRRIAALRRAAEITGRLAEETARELSTGLTAGALAPPGHNPGKSQADTPANRKH
ncbi:N-6 DNA methylase [Actinomadura sp. NPDC047616]|uniref:N-6 DNA methylase n=1 Tax=Actinomadura sp. NPDC047616 TaxID=3155914 RepID=UPI003408703C